MSATCGAYRLLERTHADALAEYFLARRLADDDGDPPVVVKRLLPTWSGTEREFFRKMFQDEVWISSILEHPNVLRVVDYGEEDGTPFLVLEHFEAWDLQAVLAECHDRKLFVPMEIAVRILAEVLRALGYVHKREDPRSGRSLDIVHRDICPASIHLGRDGSVKISNFSIARARTNVNVTDPGVLKGRYSYMSPEQARGETLDHRSDLFSCGIVLYELLTGVRPFRGKNDLDILTKVKNATHDPPRVANPHVPATLAEVIEAALVGAPDGRFEDAGEMLDALVEAATDLKLAGSAESIAKFVASLATGETPAAPVAHPPALVLGFDAPDATDVAQAGGKGASLARLYQARFPVPPGIVVTARAWRAFVAGDRELAAAIDAVDPTDPAALARDCAAIRERILDRPFPEALERELGRALPALLARGAVAVRSSSTMEDLAGAAFAGQHDTFLHVTSLEDAFAKIKRCFASLWEDRAARYRHERGFRGRDAQMAVVVQRMVKSDVAGVAFCLHPVTGELGQVMIDASWGLGETVVSGEGNVDEFVVDKKSGAIVERTISDKEFELLPVGKAADGGDSEGGTERVAIEKDRRTRPCLDDGQIEALRVLALKVERFYGFPQDLEWGIAGKKLWLLQSRPVTRFPAKWTRDESAERFPNVTTPLAWDFVSDGFHESLAISLATMGLPPLREKWFERFDGYVYGNQTAVKIFTAGGQLSFESLGELRAMIPVLRDRYRQVQHLPVAWMRDLDHYLLSLGRLAGVPLASLSDAELWNHVLAIDALGREYFRPNIAISITQGLLHRTLFRVVSLVAPPDGAAALYDALTCFCETKTNLVNRDLHALAAIARRTPALLAILEKTERKRIVEEKRLAAFPDFAAAFDRFLRDHGHREVDWDVYVPTWSGQPWVVLENVRLLAAKTDTEDPAAREESLRARQSEAEARFLALVPEDLRFVAAELLRLARAYTALDDLEHYQTTRLSIPFRAALVEAGRRLAAKKVLAEADDVFFLRRDMLGSALTGAADAGAAREQARANKSDYLRWKDAAPPWVRGETSAPSARAGVLKGMAGSPGVATGKIFRVHGVEDFSRFPKGAVLVARTTNPAWTPLFYSACAVITESGGPLSHGAVTAREVGLPAVMAVRSALSLLEDGATVRVNGTAGTVEILPADQRRS